MENFEASNFGVPTKLRLTTSGDNLLMIDWIQIYNAITGRYFTFSCRHGPCLLSTDRKEGLRQVSVYRDDSHSVMIKTSDGKYAGTGDDLTVEIHSARCHDICATTKISKPKDSGARYSQNFDASNFGVPTWIRLTTSGDNQLVIDWIQIYNAMTGQFHFFSCPSGGCRLSTDRKEGGKQVVVDRDDTHSVIVKTADDKYAGTRNDLTVEVFSAHCNDVCATTKISKPKDKGTRYTRKFSAPNFGEPTRLRLTTSGDDKLTIDWIQINNANTGRYFIFSCPSGGCGLSTDPKEGHKQVYVDRDGSG